VNYDLISLKFRGQQLRKFSSWWCNSTQFDWGDWEASGSTNLSWSRRCVTTLDTSFRRRLKPEIYFGSVFSGPFHYFLFLSFLYFTLFSPPPSKWPLKFTIDLGEYYLLVSTMGETLASSRHVLTSLGSKYTKMCLLPSPGRKRIFYTFKAQENCKCVPISVTTRCSAIAERPRCRVSYSVRQK